MGFNVPSISGRRTRENKRQQHEQKKGEEKKKKGRQRKLVETKKEETEEGTFNSFIQICNSLLPNYPRN